MRFSFVASLLLIAASATAQTSATAHNRFIYVNNQSQPNTISAFQIGSGGALTQLTNSPINIGGNGA
jgi:hypothetical protein